MDEAKKGTITPEEEVINETEELTEELDEETVEETVEETHKDLTMADILPSIEERGPIVSMKRLLEAGSHFGHQTRRWNPKMKPYIYSARSGVYIINLEQTVKKIEEAYLKIKEIVEKGGKVLFVGTRSQYEEIVKEEALRSGSFYINSRWLGGTLTNFRTIQGRIKRLRDLERQEEDGTIDLLPKKEAALIRKEKDKLSKNLEGIKEMRKVPQALFVCDPKIEHNAVAEARILKIPVFGIIDTNNDPDDVDYMIPANDDAIGSVKLIVGLMADAVVEAKGGIPVYAYAADVAEAEEDIKMDSIKDADIQDKDRPQRQFRHQQRRSPNPRREQRPRTEKAKPTKEAHVESDISEDNEDEE